MTNWTNVTTFEDLLVASNAYAPFWTAMYFMMYVVLGITFMPFGFSVAILASSFSMLIIGLFLVYMNLMNWGWLLFTFGAIIATVLWDTFFSKKES